MAPVPTMAIFCLLVIGVVPIDSLSAAEYQLRYIVDRQSAMANLVLKQSNHASAKSLH